MVIKIKDYNYKHRERLIKALIKLTKKNNEDLNDLKSRTDILNFTIEQTEKIINEFK